LNGRFDEGRKKTMSGPAFMLVGVALYMLALLTVGVSAGRRIRDKTDFIVAGRRLPVLLCTFTLFATFFGAETCIVAAGAAYENGLLGVIADPFGAGLGLLLAGFSIFGSSGGCASQWNSRTRALKNPELMSSSLRVSVRILNVSSL
jgi:Na+/pantothenate symporter